MFNSILTNIFAKRPEPFLICNLDNEIVFANNAFKKFYKLLCGKTCKLGEMFFTHLPMEINNIWQEYVKKAAKGKVCQKTFKHFKTANQTVYELSFAPINDTSLLGWSLLANDVTNSFKEKEQLLLAKKSLEDQLTEEANHIEANILLEKEIFERKQAVENFLESQERLTQIIHGNSIPTFVIDKNHIITNWNKALECLTGITSDDAVGTSNQWKAFYTNKRPTMADLILDQAPEEKISLLYTKKYRRSTLLQDSYEVEDFFELDGKAKWLFFTAAPIKNRAGEIIGAVETLQDITSRKLMEKEILEYQDILEGKVKERTLQLKKTYEQLLHAEKLSAVGKLAASIAHEFGNPIIGIRNFLKGLKKTTSLDQTDSELLELAIQECQRVKDLISNLQNFNRPTSGTVAPMDLHKSIDDMLLFCKKSFKEKKIEIKKDFVKNLPLIHAVGDQVKQVILNCLNNAQESIKGESGRIKIKTEIADNNVLLHINDSGKGIKEEDLVYIFEPFFSTKPAVEGTGLGLSVSYGIIKRHQGNIEVTNTSPKGTTFTITLPIGGLAD